MEEDIIHIKCVMLGDGASGKTYAGTRFIRGVFRDDYATTSTIYENDLKDIEVTEENRNNFHSSLKIGQIIRLDLWDTAGQEEFKHQRKAFKYSKI